MSAAARVWRDHNSHAAVEYERGTRLVRYLSFTPSGLRKFEDGIEKFERRFCRPLVREPRALALSLIRATKGAYIPGDGVIEILWEIYMQAASEGKGVEAMNGAELVAVYNDLAAAAGRGPVKAFKSKAEAVKRIGALRAAAAQPTDEQAANRARAAEDAARRLASLKKEDDGAAPAKKGPPKAAPAKKAAKAPAKKAARPARAHQNGKANGDAKPGRGPGIGAFCLGLIAKGRSNEEVLTAVREKFPDARTSAASVSWYRNKAAETGK